MLPSMTEESLHALPLDELLALMVKSVNELLELYKHPQYKFASKSKMTEVELIQKVIVSKKAEFPPEKV